MKNSCSVSVILPCFNAQSTLKECVLGIVDQTFRDWELLVLLDGCTDSSKKIIEELSAQDERIRVVISKKNRGVVRTRNLGIHLSRGVWIGFCDSDDVWLKEKLQLQLALALKVNANLVCSSFQFIGPKGELGGVVHTRSQIVLNTLLKTNAIPMSTAMFKADKKHYFPVLPDGFIHEDYAFWLTMFKRLDIYVANLPVVTTLIRQVPGSRSSNKFLAAKSHAFILRSFGNVSGLRFVVLMISYFLNALKKRL